MKDLKRKNDYSCVAYQGSQKVGFMKYVHKITDYVSYLDKEKVEWSVINVYSRRSGEFIKRFYKDDVIPARP